MGNLSEQSRAAMRAAVLLLAFWAPGASLVAAEGAVDTPAFVACKTAAAKVPTLHLSDGHMHERYEFRIRGVKGIDVTDFQCSLKTDLPPGLKLDCGKLLIWGAPQGPVGTVTDEIRIFDGSGGEQCVNVDMKIVDKPDEGWIGGDPAGKPAAPAKKPAAAPAPAAAAPAKKPVANAAATPGTVTSRPELDVELTSPVVEGTSVITGTVTTADDGKALDDTMVTGLAVQLRITKADGSRILAALTTSTPTAYQAAVNKGSFTLNLKTPLAAGDKGQLELVPDAEAGIFTLANKDGLPGFKDGLPEFAIGNDLHLPVIEVTSQLRDGVTTIEGTYRKVPSPAIASDPSATPPVVGNLPRVQVWLHDPDAPQYEWYQAALVQGTGSNQSTVSDVEAIKDGTFTATLKTALTPGQSVQIRLYPAKGHAFRTEKGLPQEYALWRGQGAGKPVSTSLAIAPPVITSVVEAGQGLISGTATPSTSGCDLKVVPMIVRRGHAAGPAVPSAVP